VNGSNETEDLIILINYNVVIAKDARKHFHRLGERRRAICV